MKAGQYETLASRTEADVTEALLARVFVMLVDDGTRLSRKQSADLLHAILGVTGEVSEYMRIEPEAPGADMDERKELGDMWWYARMIPRCFEVDIGRFVEMVKEKFCELRDKEFVRMHVFTDELTEPLKKWLFYGKPIDGEEMVDAAAKVLAHAMYFRQGIDVDDFDLETESIWGVNIEKLRRRFPDAFDQVLAQTHDGQ